MHTSMHQKPGADANSIHAPNSLGPLYLQHNCPQPLTTAHHRPQSPTTAHNLPTDLRPKRPKKKSPEPCLGVKPLRGRLSVLACASTCKKHHTISCTQQHSARGWQEPSSERHQSSKSYGNHESEIPSACTCKEAGRRPREGLPHS